MIKRLIIFSIFYFLPVTCSYAARAFPNPWIPDSKATTAGNRSVHGTYAEGIKFDGLSNSGGTIFIHNTTGELVRKVTWNAGNTATSWDGKNERSEYVASGVYIWVIQDGGTKSGKIVVIR
ncbi:MAG: hypothetical protein FWG57_01075 [Endomicrobia bacterium]|nr:hypothetical protein [Endomicrobiia bacterium]